MEEYCYEDYEALSAILGKSLIDDAKQRVRYELFAPNHREEFVQALLAFTPEIVTASEVVLSPAILDPSEEPELDGADS